MLLRNACQYPLSHYLFQIRVFKLHDQKHVVQFCDGFFFWRHNNIVNFWYETALLIPLRYFVQPSHDLYLSNQLDTIVVMFTKSLYVFDGYDLIGYKTLSLVHLTVASLSYLFYYLIEFHNFGPCCTKIQLVHHLERKRFLHQQLLAQLFLL